MRLTTKEFNMPRLKPLPQTKAAAEAAPAIRKVLNSIEDAARILSVGRTTIFALIKEGHLHSVKIKNRTLLATSELESFAARLQEGA